MEEDENVLGQLPSEAEQRMQAARESLSAAPTQPKPKGPSVAERLLSIATARPVLGGEGSDRFTSALGGVVEGATRSAASVPQALEELGTGIYNVATDSDVDATEQFNPVLDPIRQGIEFLGAKIGRGNEEFAGEFQQQLGEGLGSIAGTIAGGAIGGAVRGASALRAGKSAAEVAKARRTGQAIGSVGQGMGSIGVEGIEDYRRTIAEQGGEFEGDKAFYTFLANAGVGITEAAPVLKAFNRLDRATGGTLDNVFGDILKGSVEEATQEAAQSIAGNLIASDLVGYDPERGAFMDTAESAALGGGVGAIMNTLMSVLGGQRRSIMLEEAGEPREPGLVEKAMVTNGLSKTQTQAELEKQLQEQTQQRKQQASINPRTGQEIQSTPVKDLNRGLQQAERFAENATTEEDINLAQQAISEYRSKLEAIANKKPEEGGELSSADIIAKQEAKQLLSLAETQEEAPVTQQDTSTVEPEIRNSKGNPFKSEGAAKAQLTRRGLSESHDVVASEGGFILKEKVAPVAEAQPAEDPTTTIPGAQAAVVDNEDIDAINAAEAERLANIAKENGINLPETETTGGIFTEGDDSTADVAQTEDEIASNVWAEMTKDSPATDEQIEVFSRQFPDWYAANVDQPVAVEPVEAEQLEEDIPELTEDVATPDQKSEAIEEEAEQAAIDPQAVAAKDEPIVEAETPIVETAPTEQTAVVEEPAEIPVEPTTAPDPVVTQPDPRPINELFQAVQDGDIADYVDEITRDYGSLRNFENAVLNSELPSTLIEQEGVEIGEAEGDRFLTEQAGFDPETDQGIEDVVAPQVEQPVEATTAPATPVRPVQPPTEPTQPIKIVDAVTGRQEVNRLRQVRDTLMSDENASEKDIDNAVKALEKAQDSLAEIKANKKVKTPTRKVTDTKTELHKVSQAEDINSQIEALEQQLEEASIEGRNTVRIERDLEKLNEKLNVVNKQKEKASKIKKGTAKVASEKELKKWADDYEEGVLEADSFDDVDVFPTLDDDGDIAFMYIGPKSLGLSDGDRPINSFDRRRGTLLGRAIDKTKNGVPADQVLKETGWRKEADGHWRFEISDQNFKFKSAEGATYFDILTSMPPGVRKLGDMVEHPELFRVYPSLKDVTVMYDNAEAGTGSLHVNWGRPIITVSGNTPRNEALRVLIHEVQHAVQHIEGFSSGASTESFEFINDKETRKTLRKLDDLDDEMASFESSVFRLSDLLNPGVSAQDIIDSEFTVLSTSAKNSMLKDRPDLSTLHELVEAYILDRDDVKSYVQKVMEAYPKYKGLWRKRLDLLDYMDTIPSSYSQYSRTFGEVEARDVEARIAFSPAERRETPRYISQGIAESDYIIMLDGLEESSFSLPAWATESIIPTGEEVSKGTPLPDGRVKYTHNPGMNAKISALVDRYRKNARKFGANVVAVDDVRQLPNHVLASMFSQYGQSTQFRGLFDSSSDTIYVMRNAHKNSKDLEITLMHELVGHFGFKNMFAATGFDTYDNFLSRESARNPKLMKDAAALVYGKGYKSLFKTQRSPGDAQYVLDGQVLYVSKEDNATILDEFIAFNTEQLLEDPQGFQSKYGSFRRRLIAAIRHMFSKMGFVAKELDTQDILSLIAESNTRLFDLKNNSAITRLLGGRDGVRYQIAKYSDPESPYFDPRAADLSGAAPSGSFAREQSVAASLEANDTPFQQEVKVATERQRQADLMTVLNMIESGFGKATLNKWESTVNAAWNRLEKNPVIKYFKSFGALGEMPNTQAYRALTDLARGQVGKVEGKIKDATKAFKKMTPAQLEQAYTFFTTPNSDPAVIEGIEASARVKLKNAKQDIIDFGQTLVNMGLMSPEVYESSKGMYLPKVYYKYLTDATPGGKRISFMSYLRKQADLSREDQVALGQIEDPSLIVPQTIGTIGRDIALLQLTKNIVNFSAQKNLGWVLGEAYKVKYITDKGEAKTASVYDLEVELDRMRQQKAVANRIPAFRLSESDQAALDKRINYVSQLVQKAEQQRINEINDMLRAQGLQENEITPEVTEQYFKENYKRIPNDYAYGALSGKYVMKAIYNDFVDSGRFDEDLRDADTGKKAWRQAEIAHQYWKASKVVLNAPVSTVRNGFGNFILLDTSTNTNAGSLAKMFFEEFYQAAKGEHSKYWNWAAEAGLQGSTYASIELNQVMRNRMSQVERAIKLQTARKEPWLLAGVHTRKALGDLFALASEFYGSQEEIFKVVKLRDYIQTWEKDNNTKMDDLDANQRQTVLLQAAQAANEAIFDYGEVPNWVRILRRTPLIGSPFVTFTYKSMLKMPENFVKHPQKYAKYMALTSTALMSALTAMFDSDWDEEEVEEVVSTLSDYYNNSTAIFVYPWKDQQGRIQITDLTPFIPWSQHTSMLKGLYNVFEKSSNGFDMVTGAASEAADWSGMMGTPLVSLILTTQGNIDPFTGRAAIPENLSGNEKLQAWAKYLYNLAMPPLYTENGGLGHLFDNAGWDVGPISSGRVLNSDGTDRESTGQAAARVLGLNILPQDPNTNRRNLQYQHSAEIRDLRARIGQISRDRNMDSVSRASKIREVQERIKLTNERYRERLSRD